MQVTQIYIDTLTFFLNNFLEEKNISFLLHFERGFFSHSFYLITECLQFYLAILQFLFVFEISIDILIIPCWYTITLRGNIFPFACVIH